MLTIYEKQLGNKQLNGSIYATDFSLWIYYEYTKEDFVYLRPFYSTCKMFMNIDQIQISRPAMVFGCVVSLLCNKQSLF